MPGERGPITVRALLVAGAAAILAVLLHLALRSQPAPEATAPPDRGATPSPPAPDAGPRATADAPRAPTAGSAPDLPGARTDPVAPSPPADAAAPTLTLPIPTEPHVVATRHLSNARMAYQQQDYEVAYSQAELTLRAMPDRSSARRIAALAACALGWTDRAQEHAGELERGAFEELQSECRTHGVELEMPYAPWP